jgi:hypothetical protein
MTALPRPKGEQKLFNLSDPFHLDEPRLVEVGLKHTVDYGHSQFSGKWVYRITRIDRQTGDVFGEYESGDVYEMDEEDVM